MAAEAKATRTPLVLTSWWRRELRRVKEYRVLPSLAPRPGLEPGTNRLTDEGSNPFPCRPGRCRTTSYVNASVVAMSFGRRRQTGQEQRAGAGERPPARYYRAGLPSSWASRQTHRFRRDDLGGALMSGGASVPSGFLPCSSASRS